MSKQKSTTNQKFLAALQQEARIQQKLSASSPLPSTIHSLASLVVTYAWQSLLVISLLLAVLVTTLGVELHIL